MNQIVRRKAGDFAGPKPEILAPAGNRDAFLAALAAGADAIYCGLKSFSARMAAQNFTPEGLAAVAPLAREQGAKVYLAINTLMKPADLTPLGQQLDLIIRIAAPDALIFQDLAVAEVAKQVGFRGELHLSTLANVSMAGALSKLSQTAGIHRVVLPRELTVDEIKLAAEACPKALGLEVFIHGALCFGVSGRCYWSSYLGGKSGLRGRCVQPCRRRYRQEKKQARFFSCQDLGLDMLVKVLAGLAPIRAWKIEGRKKGPHYVYYTVTAYKMLRDEGHDPQIKKSAMQMLELALGRQATHYHFLPQRPQNPVDTSAPSGSGLLAGSVRGGRDKPYIEPRFDLLANDKLRIGYEDDAWHQTVDLKIAVPKKGKFFFKRYRGRKPAKGTPVFLIDRREPALADKINALADRLAAVDPKPASARAFSLKLPPGSPKKPHLRLMHVLRRPGARIRKTSLAIWLDLERPVQPSISEPVHTWWWLPPVIWPDDESRWRNAVSMLLRAGARRFVLNAPWQTALFRRPQGLNLWAGPFCNIANPLAVRAFKKMGGQGVIVSPELGGSDLEALAAKSVLPLGVVVSGFWPLCVSRALASNLKSDHAFTSPKGEDGWVRQYSGLNWVFPNWPVDLRGKQDQLQKFGFRLFVHLDEPVPRGVRIKKRPGLWNWKIGLK